MVYDFGERLQTARKNKKLSQKHVAATLDLTVQTISGYENNSKTPSIKVLKQLALLYNVSADFLLGLDDRYTVQLERADDRKIAIIELLLAL